MADKRENKPLLPPKTPRGNYQIWVILAMVAVIFGVLWSQVSSDVQEKQQEDLYRMVENGDVQKIFLVQNRKQIEVTLTPKALELPQYKEVASKSFGSNSSSGPHYIVKVVDPGIFDQEFRKYRDNLDASKRPQYDTGDREDYFSVFLQWGFLFLLLFGFWML